MRLRGAANQHRPINATRRLASTCGGGRRRHGKAAFITARAETQDVTGGTEIRLYLSMVKVPAGRLRPHLRGACRRGAEARADHDRLDPSEGPSHSGKPLKKGVLSRCIGRTKGGLNSKLHVVCDDTGKPLVMLLTEGQMSDHKGARMMLKALPPASALIADRVYDSDWFREALSARGTKPCIPPTRSRKTPLDYDKGLYRQPQDREPLRQTQGLATHLDPLRQMRPHLLLGDLHRSSRRLLPQSMSPDPRLSLMLRLQRAIQARAFRNTPATAATNIPAAPWPPSTVAKAYSI